MRLAPRARAGRLTASVLAFSLSFACERPPRPGDGISFTWDLAPAPPTAGVAGVVTLTLRDEARQPVRGARLQLEGHMSHPGMMPVVANVADRGDGTYEAPLTFTMAGDWVLVVSGEVPGTGRITRQTEVVGVRPASP